MKKKQFFTKTVAVGMAAGMAVSLCACESGARLPEKRRSQMI